MLSHQDLRHSLLLNSIIQLNFGAYDIFLFYYYLDDPRRYGNVLRNPKMRYTKNGGPGSFCLHLLYVICTFQAFSTIILFGMDWTMKGLGVMNPFLGRNPQKCQSFQKYQLVTLERCIAC